MFTANKPGQDTRVTRDVANQPVHCVAGSPGASVALRLLKERADSAEARAASATRQVAELKASLQVIQDLS